MKKIYALFIALIAAITVQAQTQDKALYIYRNDGGFNAFLREEIDSIKLSYHDLDSIQHNVPVCQEFYTPDSIYRIPISLIDSIGFHTPEPVYAKEVVRIEEWMPYLTNVAQDRPALTFSNTLPYTARKGDVLFYPVWDDERFPEGFAGKVIDVAIGDGITFECDSAMIEDIFERLVLFSDITLNDTSDETPVSSRNDGGGENYNKMNFSFEYNNDNFEFRETNTVGARLKLLMRIEPDQPLYTRVSFGGSVGLDLNLDAHFDSDLVQIPNDQNIAKYMTQPFIDLPIDQMGLIRFKMRAAPIMNVQGKADFEANLNASAGFNVDFTYNDGNTNFVPRCSSDCSWDAKINLKGSVFMGVRLSPYISGIANAFKVSFKIDVGPKVDGDFYLEGGSGSDVYDSLKDSKVSLSAGATFHIKPQIKVLNWESGKDENLPQYTKGLFFPIKDWYLMPLFSKPDVKCNTSKSSVSAHSVPSRDLLMPVKVGLGLHDKSGNLIEKKYCSREYKNAKDWNVQNLTYEFGNLANDKYTIYPYVNLMGFDIKANPSEDIEFKNDELCADANHVHAVDLGLSVKWACCNIDANSPEDYGGYYAWGEKSEKSEYTSATYQFWTDKDEDGYFDYDEGSITTDIAGTEYDVAHVKWGGSWRIPRKEEVLELVNKCTWQFTIINGVPGQKVTGPNGNSIFLPAVGGRYGSSLVDAGYCGCYWSSTPSSGFSNLAYYLSFDSGDSYLCGSLWRNFGFSVRPVSE